MNCDNAERGCKWVGTVATLEEHVPTCEFTLLPCPKQCKDDNSELQSYLRKDLDQPLKEDCPNRSHTCRYCGQKGTYAHITRVHGKACLKKIHPCPSSDTMKCQHLKRHVTTEYQHTVISDKYRRVGYETELKRKDVATHKEDDHDKLHLHKANKLLKKLKRKYCSQFLVM